MVENEEISNPIGDDEVMLNEDQVAVKENQQLQGAEIDDPALELEKMKRMKRLKNLKIKFIINIQKIIKHF